MVGIDSILYAFVKKTKALLDYLHVRHAYQSDGGFGVLRLSVRTDRSVCVAFSKVSPCQFHQEAVVPRELFLSVVFEAGQLFCMINRA